MMIDEEDDHVLIFIFTLYIRLSPISFSCCVFLHFLHNTSTIEKKSLRYFHCEFSRTRKFSVGVTVEREIRGDRRGEKLFRFC
jgi:hypothetical protein